ncbi:MAG: class I SAM-dependent methyltransferase [Fibrobacterota bacterium]
MAESIRIQEIMADAVNYNKWLVSFFEDKFGKRILDAGCSIGNISKAVIASVGNDLEIFHGIDSDKKAVELLRKSVHNPDCRFSTVDINDDVFFRDNEGAFDTLCCFNVLEHIFDDEAALKRFNTVLEKKGSLFLILPAIKFLYGSLDRSDNHYRRYSKKEIKKKLLRSGFKVSEINYFNPVGAIGWFINGRVLKKEIIPAEQAAFFDKMVPLLKLFQRIFPFPFGQSLRVCGIKEKSV